VLLLSRLSPDELLLDTAPPDDDDIDDFDDLDDFNDLVALPFFFELSLLLFDLDNDDNDDAGTTLYIS